MSTFRDPHRLRVPARRAVGVRSDEAEAGAAERRGELGIGDLWTFTSINPDSKLIPT